MNCYQIPTPGIGARPTAALRGRLQRLSRPCALLSFSWAVFTQAVVVGCGAESGDPQSTETGNPPLLTSDKIFVESDDDELVVTGEKGAVDPGGVDVRVSNETNGSKVTVVSEKDGSFEARVNGSAADEVTVVAESAVAGQSQSLTLSEMTSSSDSTQAGCEAICGAVECGASEPAFPIGGCNCRDGVCECTHEECVEACRRDMDDYRAQGTDCAALIPRLLGCIEAAPCELFAAEDYDAVMALPECEGVEALEETCVLGGGAQGCGFSTQTGSGTLAGPQLTECEILTSCVDANYGYDCHASVDSPDAYDCSCRRDGVPTDSFETKSGCAFPEEDARLVAFMNFRCDWELPVPATLEAAGCEASHTRPEGEKPAECELLAECDAGEFAVDCQTADDGSSVICSCTIDGEKSSTRALDAGGCWGGSALGDEEPASSSQALRAMNALCDWHLTGEGSER